MLRNERWRNGVIPSLDISVQDQIQAQGIFLSHNSFLHDIDSVHYNDIGPKNNVRIKTKEETMCAKSP